MGLGQINILREFLKPINIIKSVSISGLDPLKSGSNFIVLDKSGTFNISAPKGTRIVLGGAGMSGQGIEGAYSGSGGDSGYIFDYTLTQNLENCLASLSIAQTYDYGATPTHSTLKITKNGTIILNITSASGIRKIVTTKFIPLGGGGGGGGGSNSGTLGHNGYCLGDNGAAPTMNSNSTSSGTGNGGSSNYGGGGGGGAAWNTDGGNINGGNGGNSLYGGSGGGGNSSSGTHGNCGKTTYGTNAIYNGKLNYGDDGGAGFGGASGGTHNWGGAGGGGSYCSGGGGAGDNDGYGKYYNKTGGGKGGQGLIIFEW